MDKNEWERMRSIGYSQRITYSQGDPGRYALCKIKTMTPVRDGVEDVEEEGELTKTRRLVNKGTRKN